MYKYHKRHKRLNLKADFKGTSKLSLRAKGGRNILVRGYKYGKHKGPHLH